MDVAVDADISLAVDDIGTGPKTLLMTHGLGCDRTTMRPQVDAFRDRYRVVNVDLRGHGESSKPGGPYHPDVQAHDLARLCDTLGLDRPFLVGHSLGGVVGLRLAHLYPDLLAGLVALDSAIAVSAEVREATPTIVDGLDALEGEDYRRALVDLLGGFFLPHDDPGRREAIIAMMSTCRKDVFLSGWLETVVHTDSVTPLASLAVPMLFVAAQTSNGGLDAMRGAPNVMVAQTVGTGHFIELECADQVNAMIGRFLAVNDYV